MPEASDGGARPPQVNSSNEEPSGDAVQAARRRRNNRRRRDLRKARFEGKCADLKDFVYDVTTGKDTFQKPTREIAEYVGKTYDDAREFRIGMVELQLPTMPVPARPADPEDVFKMEIWKMAQKDYSDKVQNKKEELWQGDCTNLRAMFSGTLQSYGEPA
jgi:hypothetical protein